MDKFLIIKHNDDTHSVDECQARQLASKILEDTNLEGEAYYKEEDRITEIINNLCEPYSNAQKYWEEEVEYQMEYLESVDNEDIDFASLTNEKRREIKKEIAYIIMNECDELWSEINHLIADYIVDRVGLKK